MEEVKSLLCTRCGSHHLEKISEYEFKCQSCDAIITKEKALDFEVQYRKLQKEGKDFDIANLRNLVSKSLEGHIDKDSLVKYSQEILRILPGDVLSLFYIKFANRISVPTDYEYYLNLLLSEATVTEIDEIIDIIITNARFREKEQILNIINKFYKGDVQKQEQLEKALKQRTKEIDLFSDVPRDIFICWSSSDKDKANEILKELENDGNTCWISSRNIPWDSDNYWTNITKAIKSCDIFLCLNSINTMQSSDCRKEIEIASSLGKTKRIEYKLDEARDITLFKNFFTGQWITNINDLLDKVFDLKNKEIKLKKAAKNYLENKEYEKAKEIFQEVNDEEAREYISLCNNLIASIKFIENGMYEEAKVKLLQINEISYTKDLLEECNRNITSKTNVFYEVHSHYVREENNKNQEIKEETNKTDVLKKVKFLLTQAKDYQEAEKILFEEIAYDDNNYDLWYYYLCAITKEFKDNSHKNFSIALNNLKRLATGDNKKIIDNLDKRLNPETLLKQEIENKRKLKLKKVEEAQAQVQSQINNNKKLIKDFEGKINNYQEKANTLWKAIEENDKKISEYHKIITDAIANLKINGIIESGRKSDYLYFGSYPQLLKDQSVKINSKEVDKNGYYTGSDGKKYGLINKGLFKKLYYRVDPIRWRIVKYNKNSIFVVSDMILDNHLWDYRDNNYQKSEIRSWLNNSFYNKAFSDKQKEIIQITILNDSLVKDKVFLLNKNEALNHDYHLYELSQISTEYAKEQGVSVSSNGKSSYYLRSYTARSIKDKISAISSEQKSITSELNDLTVGILPAMLLSLNCEVSNTGEFTLEQFAGEFSLDSLCKQNDDLRTEYSDLIQDIHCLQDKIKELTLETQKIEDNKNNLIQSIIESTIELGMYPQSIKNANVTITTSIPNADGYYLGDDGNYYAKLAANPHSKGKTYYFSNNEQIILGKEYYFKVEPIVFDKLHGNNANFYLSQKIIDTMAYQDEYYEENNKYYVKSGITGNNYQYSKVRKVLNTEFVNKAFSIEEQAMLEKTLVDNSPKSTGLNENPYACKNTYDYVFLPSVEEMTLSSNGFKDQKEKDKKRVKETTDYAKANGAYLCDGIHQNYFLRSPHDWITSFVETVCYTGNISGNDFSYAHNGVAVAISLKNVNK